MPIDIDLQIECSQKNIPSKAQFLNWVTNALETQIERATLTLRVVDPEEIQQLNQTYREKDKPTNVLSFPFEAPQGLEPEDYDFLLGDLIICASVVHQEAMAQNKPTLHHWAHMVTHGALHLLGYDHISEDEAQEMETLEIQLMAKLNIADPYQLTTEV